MGKLVTFFLFCFVGMSILSGIMEGGGGFITTKLDGATSDTAVVITVDSTDGFLSEDIIVIEDEQIYYTGTTAITFTGCTRGYQDTKAEAHADEAGVYTQDASVINNALGFNANLVATKMGAGAAIGIPWNLLTKSLPRLAMLNFSFMVGDLMILGIFWYVAAAGFFVTLAIQLGMVIATALPF